MDAWEAGFILSYREGNCETMEKWFLLLLSLSSSTITGALRCSWEIFHLLYSGSKTQKEPTRHFFLQMIMMICFESIDSGK